MTFSSRGYRPLPFTAARAERWSVSVEGGPSYENLPVATDWTYFQGIRARVELLIEHPGLHARLGVAPDAQLGVTLSWRTRRVGLRGTSAPVPIERAETAAFADIPAGAMGGILALEARIIMLDPGRGSEDPLAPSEVGAILWSDTWSVTLEGVAPRLPIVPVPAGRDPFFDYHDARWYVSVDVADLEAPIDAVVRIFVNDANENVRRMMLEPEGDAASAMTSSLLIDVQRELIRLALDDDTAFAPDHDYPEGSLGAAMSTSLKLFGGDFDELQARAHYDAARFDVQIQGLLGEEHARA